MTVPSRLYRPSLALLTDFYELTMAYAAWKSGVFDFPSIIARVMPASGISFGE